MLSPTEIRDVFTANGFISNGKEADPFERIWSISHPADEKLLLIGFIIDPRPSATQSRASLYTSRGTLAPEATDPLNIAISFEQVNSPELFSALVAATVEGFKKFHL
jgi:hypothetical protein